MYSQTYNMHANNGAEAPPVDNTSAMHANTSHRTMTTVQCAVHVARQENLFAP